MGTREMERLARTRKVVSLAEARRSRVARQQREKLPLEEQIRELDSATYTLLDMIDDLQERVEIQERWIRRLTRLLIELGSSPEDHQEIPSQESHTSP